MAVSVLDEIVKFFVELYKQHTEIELPHDIVMRLNDLDRAERGELKARLFNEAKKLAQGNDGLSAIRWIETSFMLIEKNSFRLHEVMFSPGQDIPENIAFYLSQAKKSIDICVYTISDEVLSKCLKTMHRRGVKVRIITDNNKMRDAGSQIKDLAREGIPVKIDSSKYHMHNKFGVIDGRITFTGSYNWTYTAKQYNQENIVITTNYRIVHQFIEEFERLWDDMLWLRVKINKGDKANERRQRNGITEEEEDTTLSTEDFTVETHSDELLGGDDDYVINDINPFDQGDLLVPMEMVDKEVAKQLYVNKDRGNKGNKNKQNKSNFSNKDKKFNRKIRYSGDEDIIEERPRNKNKKRRFK
ncbi:MAG: DUF1669 domain-containing protein [Marinilabiliaceae bacterium]|nr:DUF1669 domain-containing protein [Marinilabiliaceae bacterium]